MRVFTLVIFTSGLCINPGLYADPLPVPLSGSDVLADKAFMGDPLWGLDVGDPGNLYQLKADVQDHEASVTKSMTLHLGVESIEAGNASLNDTITVSGNSVLPQVDTKHSAMPLVTGDQVRFEDMLLGMMITSAGDASVANAEHTALKTFPFLQNSSTSFREFFFTLMMNAEADALGLQNTTFFNAYGSDHGHDAGGQNTGIVGHLTTARDISKWFSEAMESPLFRRLAGTPTYNFNTLNGGKNFAASKTGFSYPGIVGDKVGGNDSCWYCRVSMAHRIGRDLAVSFMQPVSIPITATSKSAQSISDRDTLFDYGFSRVFDPQLQAQSGAWGPVSDQSLACVSHHRAVSAVVNPDGKTQLITWRLNLDQHSIRPIPPRRCVGGPGGRRDGSGDSPPEPPTRASDAAVTTTTGDSPEVARADSHNARGHADHANRELQRQFKHWAQRNARMQRREDRLQAMEMRHEKRQFRRTNFSPAPVGPGCNSTTDPDSDIGVPALDIEAVKIKYVGAGYVILAEQTAAGITLSSWGIPPNGPVFFRDKAALGTGSQAHIHPIFDGMFITAHVDAADNLILKTWRLDLDTGAISNAPLDTQIGGQTGALTSLDGRGLLFFAAHILTTRNPLGSDNVLVEAWDVNPFNGSISLTTVRLIANNTMAAATFVPGVDPILDTYAIASRNNSGNLLISVFQWQLNNSLLPLGLTNPLLPLIPISPSGRITIAAYREGGIITVVKEDQASTATRQDVWALATNVVTPTINPQVVVTNNAPISGNLFASCYVPDLSAEGDFLISQRDFFSQQLEVNGWRSGDRP